VDPREADERYARLLANVSEVRELLTQMGEDHWANWMAAVQSELAAHDGHALNRLLAAYGGMGSLNDVYIHPINGHPVVDDDVDSVNRALADMRSAMHDDATALLHELEQAP
jgi:hypothetical protein